MKPVGWIGMVLAILALHSGTAMAGSETRLGTGGALELRLPAGARSTALAGADIGSVSGAEALFYNPAGLAATESATEVLFSHTDYVADMDVNYFGVAQRIGGLGMLGLSVKVLSVGEIPVTTESAPDGTGDIFSPTFSTLGVTYARQMTDRVNFGGTLYYVSEKVLQETAATVAFDFGFQYDTDYRGLKLAMTMKNYGPNTAFGGADFDRLQRLTSDDPQSANRNVTLSPSSFELPSYFQMGLSYPVFREAGNTLSLHGLYQSNSFGVDEGRVGAEWMYRKDGALRVGYKFSSNEDDLFGLSYGAGIRVPLGGTNLWVDYAGQQVSDFFDDVQHVAVSIVF